jgi:pyroglutamyl-peptidase
MEERPSRDPRSDAPPAPGPWLVTAFEPYLGPVNATAELVASLQADWPEALADRREQVHFRVLPVDTATIAEALGRALSEVNPAGLVLLGQAPGRKRVDLELRAVNRLDFPRPDNAGHQPRGEPIEVNAPEVLATSLPDPEGAVRALVAAGVPAATSEDAGRYLCNQVFYLARRCFSGPAGFVHVPVLPGQLREGDDPGACLDLESQRLALTTLLSRWVPREPPSVAS